MPRPNYGRFINMLGESVQVPLLDPTFAFMKEQLDVEGIRILDSCNGLLLFGHRWGSDTHDSRGYIVCNPVTEQWVAVPSSGLTPPPPAEGVDEEDSENDVRTFLHFDPSISSHFGLVQFWQDEYRENVEGVRTYSSECGLWSDRHSFKSPAIAVFGSSSYDKYPAISRYSPLYSRLASAITVLEVIRYILLAGDLKPW
ncbi:uncharacterized protein LOC120659577 [Panicum virgatum]|uniref:uncharacterized protein LOC120659577 n=1 Tax=Panicum virgatum TaxID=38727 RepID=UPI0019D56A0F|nr:uncharacterized protein LOC120659577 [Panicum virgatum]